MTRDELLRSRQAEWERLTELLKGETPRPWRPRLQHPAKIQELSRLYRNLASDLMRVRRDKLGKDLELHLDALASRAHNVIYAGVREDRRLGLLGLLRDFPTAVRRNRWGFGLACLLFFGSGVIAFIAALTDESYAVAVLGRDQLSTMEQMYRDSNPSDRNFNTDSAMTGYYVFNNVGIAFRCFATGLLYGLGPIYYLLFNGITIGAVFGHLIRVGLGEKIGSFVSLHSPWELTAIAIAGGAGLQMGWTMVRTGGRTRIGNLRAHGLELLRQVLGAAAFLMLAAFIEGNLSPSSLPVEVKYGGGIMGWLVVIMLLAGFGRSEKVPADVEALRL